MLYPPEKCLRYLDSCSPLAQIASDTTDDYGEPVSFVCVGANDGSDRAHDQDCYTLCWKSSTDVDTRDHVDLTDLLHTQSVIAQALTHLTFVSQGAD